MKTKILLGILFLATISACANFRGKAQGRVAMVDSTERMHLNAKLNMTDLMATAEKLTNDMLMSDVVSEWNNERPRLYVKAIKNNTDIDNIPEEQIYDRIKGLILESGVAKIFQKESNNIEYILSGVLDSTTERSNDGSLVRGFIITLNLASVEGEELGRWKHQITLAKAKRPLF